MVAVICNWAGLHLHLSTHIKSPFLCAHCALAYFSAMMLLLYGDGAPSASSAWLFSIFLRVFVDLCSCWWIGVSSKSSKHCIS